jgi:hypothetical protein
MLLLDERRALEAIPTLLKGHEEQGPRMMETIRALAAVDGSLSEEAQSRLLEVGRFFEGSKSGLDPENEPSNQVLQERA